eukprot:tig00020912_g15823.t1
MAKGRKKRRTHVTTTPEENAIKIPKSFVFCKGEVGHAVRELMEDLRLVMEPNTARKLKVRKTNKIKDFVHVAGPLGVSHFLVLTCTDVGTYLRAIKVPHGPTLTFRLCSYSTTADVHALQKRPHSPGNEFRTAPLVVLSNFGGAQEKHVQLMAVVFQNMFPSINVQTVKLSECRRIVLLHYDKEQDKVEFRHYAITASPVGISKTVKRVVQAKIPSLSNFEDVSEYVMKSGYASDSDVEDGPDSRVTLSQNYVGRGNRASQLSAIRLVELGPRMQLELVKIEDQLCTGEVMYHRYVHKTAEEVAAAEKLREEKKLEKARRRAQQEANVARKKKQTSGSEDEGERSGEKKKKKTFENEPDLEEDDDAAYYREAVGAEPDPDELISKRRSSDGGKKKFNPLYKRKKSSEGKDGGDGSSRRPMGKHRQAGGAGFKRKGGQQGDKSKSPSAAGGKRKTPQKGSLPGQRPMKRKKH